MIELPVIDVAPLLHHAGPTEAVGAEIDGACRDTGFFYVTGHGVDPHLRERLDTLARRFFARPEGEKARIGMDRGGLAWRGWFPVGGELTSGQPDLKEGLYFGRELGPGDPRVRAGVPLHGPNLFPEQPAGLRGAVLAWMDALTALGHALCRGLAAGLGLDAAWFDRHLTADPTILFRIFRYPPATAAGAPAWGVGAHTDYGLLTLLAQDSSGGLEVHGPGGWFPVPPLPGTFVCNLGDMLDRMTGGRYRSTPHRVRNTSGTERLAYPFFFDPGWEAAVRPVPFGGTGPSDDADRRWDRSSVHSFEGTYGDYLLTKVSKVFPELGDRVLDQTPDPPSGVTSR